MKKELVYVCKQIARELLDTCGRNPDTLMVEQVTSEYMEKYGVQYSVELCKELSEKAKDFVSVATIEVITFPEDV